MTIKQVCVYCVCLYKPKEFVMHGTIYPIIISCELYNWRTCHLYAAEKQCSIHGHGEHWDSQRCRVKGAVEIDPDTEIRVIRKGVLR